MFKDNTVFVIGAGASDEFGLPIGWKLMREIKENCSFAIDQFGRLISGPRDIFYHYERKYGRELQENVQDFNERLKAALQIRDGIDSADSIDEYIYRYSENPLVAEVGKLQIAYAISKAEEASILGPDSSFTDDISVADKTWIWPFFKSLINGLKASEAKKIGSNITIICFNYDRCIEHYLEHALIRSFYGMKLDEAREIVKNINIIHPYGKLGDLDDMPYGKSDRFPLMAENLITWSETIKEPTIIDDMVQAIKSAKQLVFMGFGFANQNMQLLNTNPKHQNYNGPQVYSTGYLMPKEIEDSLRRNIDALYSSAVLEDMLSKIHFQYGAKCREFFDIHRINLVR